jgi:gliding motility-associated lipoprotein GldD
MNIKNSIFIVFILLLASCSQDEKWVPKPHGFFRINFDEKEYIGTKGQWPYQFEYPKYADIQKEEGRFSEPYWINLVIAKHNAQIHLSYKPVQGNLDELVNDSHELAYKHALKAISIGEKIFENPGHRVYGTVFEIKGNAASPMQFHLTDSTKHFVRGSFYISEIPNYDSLLPVIQYIESDILHLIETFNWN